MTDRSNGYESVAAEFLSGRGRAPSTAIDVRAVRNWARTLPRGASVTDLGCGSGLPITKAFKESPTYSCPGAVSCSPRALALNRWFGMTR
jgi:methylase of polypeptide subunit release factors